MRRIRLVILGLLILAAAGYLAWRWGHPPLSDADQIKGQILKTAKAVEDRRVSTLMSIVADDYFDGTYRKADLANLARGGILSGPQWQVAVYLKGLRLQGDSATSTVDVEIREQPSVTKRHYHVSIDWRKGRRGWQVISAQGWQEAQELGSGPELPGPPR